MTYQEYGYKDAQRACTHDYLMPAILKLCAALTPGMRVLDVGCGNGSLSAEFIRRGCDVVGIDLSEQGIDIARRSYPSARFEVLGADEQILVNLKTEPFDLVLSTEVVEHLYNPRPFARGCFVATKPGGRFICSTPYHGYLKNIAVAVSGGWDKHVNPLWDGGHIKFWSRATLTVLLSEAGYTNVRFAGTGRMKWLWKSMVLSGDKPG